MRTLKRTPLRWLLPAVSFLCFMSARSSHAVTACTEITINDHGGSYKIKCQATNTTSNPMPKSGVPSWPNSGDVVGQANVTTALTSAATITLTGTSFLNAGNPSGSTQYSTNQNIQSTGVYNFGPGSSNETRINLVSGHTYTANEVSSIRSGGGGAGLFTDADDTKVVTAG